MQAIVEITPWHWVGFIVCVLIFLALDLGWFHRDAHVVQFREAFGWAIVWFVVAMVFAGVLAWWRGRHEAVEFTTGYFIELSLSMDNVFVIALIFSHFKVKPEYQHRVLFWGILGVLVMRGLMIGVGVALINQFDWLLYGMGLLLLFAGVKMLIVTEEGDPEKSYVLRVAKSVLPFSNDYDGQKFVTRIDGRRLLTPLFLVLLMVETTDLFFAVDSIPAVFGVTRKPFIVFSSNVFAILGLRSLYFVLAGAIKYFRYLKIGLSVILVFIGIKMLVDPHDNPPRWFQYDLPDSVSLLVVMGIIALSMLASVVSARAESSGDGKASH